MGPDAEEQAALRIDDRSDAERMQGGHTSRASTSVSRELATKADQVRGPGACDVDLTGARVDVLTGGYETSDRDSAKMESKKGGIVVVFQGEVLPIGALLERVQAAPPSEPAAGVGVRHTAAENARHCADLLAAGDSPDACWRFGILQTLDDYTSTLRRGGAMLAAEVFAVEPPRTGSTRIDAAFAALADYLAERDRWQAPAWARNPARRTSGWYPAVPAIFREEADRDSPRAFRQRGILITGRSLDRA